MTLLTAGGKKDFATLNRDTFIAGKKTVAVAGTAEQLPSNAVPQGFPVIVKALAANSGKVHGAKTQAIAQVDATAYELAAGEAVGLLVSNTNKIWVDANTSGEGVTFTVETD